MNDDKDRNADRAPDPTPDSEHDDTPMTRQQDVDDIPGRQKYRSARPPGDYTGDFGADGTIAHPVKGADEEASSSASDEPSPADRQDRHRP